jgi:MFS superfamily sulfate permease-like transporter
MQLDNLNLTNNILASIRNTRLTYFIVLTGVCFIGIYHLLPPHTQIFIGNFIRNPMILAVLLLGVLVIGYFNIISGIILLVLFTCIFLPTHVNQPVTTTKITETFTSKKDDDGLNSNNKVIKDLFKPGRLRKELEEAQNTNKERFEAEMANNKFLELESKKKQKKQKDNKDKEKFTADIENARAIEQRKFNPASNEDMNLLQTMEICDDIRDRIKYNYEDKKYLKRYIKEKLEEVVDLLDLVVN